MEIDLDVITSVLKELTSKWHGNETWEESEHKVKDLISNTLQIDADNIEIERAHRVGKKRPTSDKPRTIVAKFLNYKHRDMVLNERRKLKGSNLIIREDFSDRVVAKRELLPQMFEARKEGKIAYLSYDKLVIRQSRYRPCAPGHSYDSQPFNNNMTPFAPRAPPPFAPRAPIPRPMFVMAPNGPFPAEFNRKCPTTTTRI